MKRHQHLLLVKCLHEIGHILTPLFMEKLKRKKSNDLYSTPKRIGTMKKGKNTIGDAGYGLEEILSGGRMFHERLKSSSVFTIEALAVEKVVNGKRKRFEVKDSFLNRCKKTLNSFQVKDDELIDIRNDDSIFKRKSAELFLPSCCDISHPLSFHPEVLPVSYRRV
jgi:hypothetical protein